jgi:hypothetical protein
MLEVMAPEGETVGGALVPLGDRHALAAAIVTRLVDPELAASEGRAGRMIVQRNHNLGGWAERLCALTERVAAGRGPG